MTTLNCIQAITSSVGDNPVILIDLQFLKNCPQLEGADILKKLFGITDDDNVFCYKLKMDNGYATILRDFRITHKQWFDLLLFLKTNNISETNLSMEYLVNNNSLEHILETLEDVMATSLKFGGIPKFETFYDEFYEKINNYYVTQRDQLDNNPLLPVDDKKNKFIWTFFTPANGQSHVSFQEHYKYSDGWSATQRIDSSGTWYRKLKDGTEGDIEAIYTASEVEDEILQFDDHEGQIQNEVDEVDEVLNEVLDVADNAETEQQPWIDNDQQDIPYHSGW